MKFKYDTNKPFWFNHAHATIVTDDLDPVYVGVHRSIPKLGEARVHRFLMAMILYYHIGLSCQIADSSTDDDFWDVMQANYEGSKRGTERRYFRGVQGQKCLDYLRANYKNPTEFWENTYRPKYSELMKAYEKIPAFGPYFVWKAGDFYDRILGMPVEPDTCVIHLPGEPLKGMELVRSEMISLGREEFKSFTTEQMFSYMQAEINEIGLMAPPLMDRLIDIREVETAMCMLKHYHNGSDYVGKDLLDKFESLNGYGETAEIIQSNIPKPVPRDFFSPPAEVVAKLGIKLSKAGLEEPVKNLNNTTNLLAFA